MLFETLDNAALADVIGPDTIQRPPAPNGPVAINQANSVTLSKGMGADVAASNGNVWNDGNSALVAKKLEVILQGLEQKGKGGAVDLKPSLHTMKREELQEMQKQLETHVKAMRSPTPPLTIGSARRPPLRYNDPDLEQVERNISRKLAEMESRA